MIDLDDTEEFDNKLEYAILNSARDGILQIDSSTACWLVKRLFQRGNFLGRMINLDRLYDLEVMTPKGPARIEIVCDDLDSHIDSITHARRIVGNRLETDKEFSKRILERSKASWKF